ncbi:hypothetical protein [Hymenobacter sp. YC55]|uniref:hypothetical protein n=1 Tax=Hymenobacter sp. YC55 TaxID=3034019 RepID=UPI0023F69835|nr:hypothetical protein [Hymenobacter sp. YC55]MDF7810447.1 hypothetical protein [Hymenobacter sp. YC55]
MSIFGSGRQPSGTMGGLLSALFGGNSTGGDATGGNISRNTGGFSRKLAGGALLAAGAAYLYNRNKNKSINTPRFTGNE